MKKIILTGGGTAGHVTPNIALLPSLKEAGYEVFYIGSYTGIEKTLIENLDIPYYGISSGKLRRYFDLKNFSRLLWQNDLSSRSDCNRSKHMLPFWRKWKTFIFFLIMQHILQRHTKCFCHPVTGDHIRNTLPRFP